VDVLPRQQQFLEERLQALTTTLDNIESLLLQLVTSEG
jgi:hypothetical protein